MFCEGGDRSYRCLDVEFISVCLPLFSCQRSSFLLSSSVSELVFKTPVDFTEPSTSSLSARKSPMIPCQSESVCVDWTGPEACSGTVSPEPASLLHGDKR